MTKTRNNYHLPISLEALTSIEHLRIASIFLCAGVMSARLYEDFVQEVREQARRIVDDENRKS